MLGGINDYGVNAFLARRLNINDTPAPASSLAPELMPVVLALPPSQEDRYLRGERLCGAVFSTSPLGANYSVATLQNPANSGMIVCVDAYILSNLLTNSSINFYLEKNNLPSLTQITTGVLDSRWNRSVGGTLRTFAVARVGVTTTAPNAAWVPFWAQGWTTGNTRLRNNLECVIEPGAMLIIYTADANSVLDISLLWRERPAQPSELV